MNYPNSDTPMAPLRGEEAMDFFARLLPRNPQDVLMSDEEARWGLISMTERGTTADEMAAAVVRMRSTMIAIEAPENAIDVCGTGGDGQHTLNVSTAVAIVVAACGVPVAKHGNRAASSKAGAADTLEALGVNLNIEPNVAEKQLADLGICFLFAQNHHPALKRLAPIRKSIGRPTIFNKVAPLANPARVKRQLIGVADEHILRGFKPNLWPTLEMERVMLVSGGSKDDGTAIDEVSVADATKINSFGLPLWVGDEVTPEIAGVSAHPLSAIRGGDAAFNAAALRRLLEGERGAYRDAVLLNAAAALIVAGEVDSWHAGVEDAAEAIDKGLANALLNCWIAWK